MPPRIRWTAYAGVSTALAGGVVLKALAQRPNFYSASVYLSQSSANLMILTNWVFVVACTVLLGLQKLLFGPLRPIEVEQLYEKAWFAVTETLLAMTIFRGEIGAWFLIMFFALLAGKVWGWIGEGRVEILEQQPPRNPRMFHTRLALSLGLSVGFDLTMLEYVVNQVMRMARPDMMVMFGFEFAVLSILSLSTAARYAINLVEIGIVREQKRKRSEEMKKERVDAARRAIEEAERAVTTQQSVPSNNADSTVPTPTTAATPSLEAAQEALRAAEQPIDENEIEVEGWEGKGRWVFYLDLATDFFKLVVYLSFFTILLIFYGLPIHIMRDVFLTCRSFFKRIADFVKYRTATRDMNERYPDATVEEIGREDVCIICREEMRPYQAAVPQAGGEPAPPNPVAERMRPKKLPCGHVLHFSCLRSWLERQQICPTCRTPVIPPPQAGTTAGPVQPGVQPVGAAPGQHPPGDRPGPRVYQFGPLRIGVGAARGNNMFEELQQRLADNRQGAAPPAPNHNGPQQYGFGIRWDGVRRRGTRRTPVGSVREQLDAVERQLTQELEAMDHSAREYGVLRNMQLELDRLRAQRAGNAPNAAVVPPAAGGAQVQPPVQPPPGQPNVSTRPAQRTYPFDVDRQGNVLFAGSDNLPPGMTLPEGWSMVPLAPAWRYHAAPAPTAVPGFRPPTFPNINMPANVGLQTGAPEYIQAMFNNMPNNERPPETHVSHAQHPNGGLPQNPTPGQVPEPSERRTANHVNEPATVPGFRTATEQHEEFLAALRNSNESDPVLGFRTATEQHEEWLASLRNRQAEGVANTTNGDPGSSDRSEAHVNGEASQPSLPVISSNGNEDTVSAQPSLPAWGTPSVAVPSETAPSSSATPGGISPPADRTEQSQSDQQSTETPKRHATVEDLVEDPD